MTPMMQQYLDVKAQYPDALLMFRLGDFYELFFDDAVTASRVLDITLTGRDAGSAGRVPMCGVPYHSADQYIAKLIDHGYCVAICEQVEDPKQARGLVKREVIRVITPGTAPWDEGARNRFLAAVVFRRRWGIAFIDVGCGEVWWGEYSEEGPVADRLWQWSPAEVLAYEGAADHWPWLTSWLEQSQARRTDRPVQRDGYAQAEAVVLGQYGVRQLGALGLDGFDAGVEALGLALAYVQETQRSALAHLRTPRPIDHDRCLWLDATALRHLELVETVRTRQRSGSLLGLLDRTHTAMGGRLLRRWLERPLADVARIEERLEAVQALHDDLFLREQVAEVLADVYDLDRLTSRLSLGSAGGRDLQALARSLRGLPQLRTVLTGTDSRLLQELAAGLPDFVELVDRIERTLVDQPPVSVREGGLIRDGADPELDELRQIGTSAKRWLAELEQRERERTGIRNLKVGYNKVFGYYIEVSKANAHLVPDTYERRQTLTTGERFVIPELKEQEARILGAEERIVEREYELFCELRDACLARLADIQQASERLAQIDALLSLAVVAAERGYVRPVVTETPGIRIVQGRHPVVEAAHPGRFVPNDVTLSPECHLILLTGPNMAGKSTYMRQVALIVVMAQMGSFVPAQEAVIGLVDRIFTRIGASDDLSAGRSTFMVEMVELAQILRQATDRSLVLLDEIGRGTSTYDGLSIAEAVMEALHQPGRRPFTLFATHYHELTETAASLPHAANYSVAVQETEEGIVFLHTVVPRPADKSYGIQVARLAGIPEDVIERAQVLLARREQQAAAEPAVDSPSPAAAASREGVETAAVREAAATVTGLTAGEEAVRPAHAATSEEAVPVPLFAPAWSALLQDLAAVDAMRLTPLQALERLHDLAQAAREVLMWGESGSCRRP